MVRVALAGVTAMLVTAATGAAATLPAFTLHDGQTRYLRPGQAHPGAVVRCIVGAKLIDSKIPAGPPTAMVSGVDAGGSGGLAISIDRRPNGATQLRCGTATAGTGFFTRSPSPYLIGQNGLALIRGSNHLSALERIYGPPRTLSAAKRCRAEWHSLGLAATFADDRCEANSVLVGAVVDAPRWHSLSGVQVGDSVAKLLWVAQGAKPLPHGRWLLASGGTSHHARLVAVTSVGAVVRLVLTGA